MILSACSWFIALILSRPLPLPFAGRVGAEKASKDLLKVRPLRRTLHQHHVDSQATGTASTPFALSISHQIHECLAAGGNAQGTTLPMARRIPITVFWVIPGLEELPHTAHA